MLVLPVARVAPGDSGDKVAEQLGIRVPRVGHVAPALLGLAGGPQRRGAGDAEQHTEPVRARQLDDPVVAVPLALAVPAWIGRVPGRTILAVRLGREQPPLDRHADAIDAERLRLAHPLVDLLRVA